MTARSPNRARTPKILFRIPKNFPSEEVPSPLRNYAHWFLNLLHSKWVNWQYDQFNYTHLKHRYLINYIPKPHWVPIRDLLLQMGVVESNHSYCPNVYSTGYRLTPTYYISKAVPCDPGPLLRKLKLRIQKEERSLTPTQRWLLGKFEIARFDYEQAKNIIEKLIPDDPEDDVQEYRTQRSEYARLLADARWFLKPDRYGRTHTPVTSLDKTLRCCLSLNDFPIIGIDLKNSQPLIAGILARRYFQENEGFRHIRKNFEGHADHPYCYKFISASGPHIPADVEDYIRCCEKGDFYESFMSPKDNRNEFKIKFYQTVLFGRNCFQNHVKDAFAKRYPSILAMLIQLKKPRYQTAAHVMQNLEATIFIHKVCGRVRNERPDTPILTIHDSLLTTEINVKYLRGIILEEFAKFEISPALTIEAYQ